MQPDGSPLRLGTQGQHDGASFEIVGRIQLSFGDGFWNEWYLLYSGGQTGWLGEAMGEYFINSLAKTSGGLPPPRSLSPGDGLSLAGESFVATGTVTSTLSSFEGELPFIVESREPFLTVDLRSTSGKAATIDYSENPPLLFMGEFKPFDAFKFQGLRVEGEGDDERARSSVLEEGIKNFACPSCGAGHTVAGGVRSKVLVCEYCGAAVDISNPQLQILWKEEKMREQVQRGVTLAIGSKTRLEGGDFTLIGFIKKSVSYEGIDYPWTEYLLYNQRLGYRWLVEGDGHFMLMEPMAALPRRGDGPVTRPDEQSITYEGKTFRHFQTSNPKVDAVAGEFYWRIRQHESATNFDYVCPPEMLSLEFSEAGFVWSKGRYLTQEEVRGMFGLDKELRPPVGVAACQPNPYGEAARFNWRLFWAASLVGWALMLSGLLAGGGKEVWSSKAQSYATYRTFEVKESEPFKVGGRGNLAFDFHGSLNNRWMFFDTSLVDAKTNKEVAKVGSTVEKYRDGGSPDSTVRVSGIPAGEYKLRWTVKSGTKTSTPEANDAKIPTENVSYKITLRRGVEVWGWFYLMVFALLPIPMFVSARRSSFETKRWYSSDHG